MEKMTKVQALAYVMDNCSLPTEVMEKITAMWNSELKARESAKTRAKNGTGKPSAHKTENETIKADILAQMKPNKGYQVMDMAKEFTFSVGEVTPNRLSAIVTQLKNSGEIIRYEEKRKAFFRLATEEDFALEALEV